MAKAGDRGEGRRADRLAARRPLPVERGRFLATISIGLPRKVHHIPRDGRVSPLPSDPTGSGLTSPPVVLAGGDAVAPDAESHPGPIVDVL